MTGTATACVRPGGGPAGWADARPFQRPAPHLVGRAAETAGALRSLSGGRGVLIAGSAGAGKTALATAVAAGCAAGGAAVTWVVATAASRLTPFGALGPLLPAELAAVHPALVPGLLRRGLTEPAGGRPVLLVVEDAELLDEHSAAAVLALVAGGFGRLIVTMQAGADPPDAVTVLWKDALLDRWDLGPLDRGATRSLLADRLGGDVAASAVELLWTHSQGNPLFLTELIRYGTETGRLRRDAGVWWWRGSTGVPPRVAELLRWRLRDLSPAGREALDVLALAEPVPYETIAAVVPAAGILEADERGLVSSDERGGVVRLRFAHPLLRAIAAERLTPARRRSLGARLRAAPADHVGLLHRAAWEDAGGDPPDVGVLLTAADAVVLRDAPAGARLADRAVPHDRSPRAALTLAHALAEGGRPDRARAALTVAVDRVTDERDRLAVGLEDVSLSLWSERRPAAAAASLAAVRAALPAGFRDDLDSAAAVVSLFTARPAAALRDAEAVLGRRPTGTALVRAGIGRLGALALADRPADALAAAARLLADLRAHPVSSYRAGLAHALVALAELFCRPGAEPPRAHGWSGRWPAPPPGAGGVDGPGADGADGAVPAWPLLAGLHRLLAGDWPAAVPALREAFVQQRAGEGLFRSEAAAALIVALAESGAADEAAGLLADHPPDDVAVLPGLRPWAGAAAAAAAGQRTVAGRLALTAAAEANAAGATLVARWFLADAARFGAAADAVVALDALPGPPRADRARAWTATVRAIAAGRSDALLHGARHRAGPPTGPAPAPVPGPGPAAAPAAGLTARELEIAAMAAAGMTDRAIAETLVLSVRTVESHLVAAYRKLGIRSRKGLAAALAGYPVRTVCRS